MKLEMRGQMRLEQRMKLAPHMIQSMEILQLPIIALQERIEHELNSNPVLELEETTSVEPENKPEEILSPPVDTSSIISKGENFESFERIDDSYKEYVNESETFHKRVRTDDPDVKLEAIKNTVAPGQSLHDFLSDQWRLVDTEEPVKKAGDIIIDYLDNRGYLTVRLEQLHDKANELYSFDDLEKALSLVQQLEPSGVGARDLRECLLIQMRQFSEDMTLEMKIVEDYMDELLDNHLPQIAKKTNCSIEQVTAAIERMSRLDTSPGLQIGRNENHPITADVIAEWSEELNDYVVRLAEYGFQNLKINNYYVGISKSKDADDNTKKFLQKNIRSAQWIIDAVEQRKSTLLKVSRAIVRHQHRFFDHGPSSLKPLPMSIIADEVGVHLATVSRAVAGKYLQCNFGLVPLRKFFSGGTSDVNGDEHSWEAVRVKLCEIIDNEDKSKPLNDEQIRQKLAESGIENIARRTVAKYRKLLNIPTARLRRKYD